MLRVMVVGCGGIAPAHIEGFLNFPDQARVTVLAGSSSPQRPNQLNEKYALNARVVTDYTQALDEVDVVSVCTPPGTHAQIAVRALEAGCHVLLEKPMAPSLVECDAILNAANRAGRLCAVVAQSRFISGIRNALDLVKSGRYGPIRYARVNSAWYRGQSYYDLSWRGRWTVEGGGCTLNHSIHHIDLLLWAKGLPQSLTATLANLGHENSEEEDFSSSFLTYADGSVAEITSSLISHGEPQQLAFQMRDAGVEIPFRAYASTPRENGFPVPDDVRRAQVEADFTARPQLEYENHDGQIANFLAAIAGREPLLVSGQDGRRAIELITGIYQSAITGKPVTFPLAGQGPYYTGQWRETAPHFHEKTRDISSFADTTITNFKGKF